MRLRSEATPPEEPKESDPQPAPPPRRRVPAEVKETIAEASGPLSKAMEEANNTEDPHFGPIPKASGIPLGFARVVTKVFIEEIDFDASYDKLMTLLRSIEGRSEKAFQKDALSKAPEGHQLACRLLATAKRVLSNWESDNAVRNALMRERGFRSLQAEKEGGGRNKTITDKDTDDRAALIFPNDWKETTKQRREYELMVKNLETVVESFNHFNSALRSLVGSS